MEAGVEVRILVAAQGIHAFRLGLNALVVQWIGHLFSSEDDVGSSPAEGALNRYDKVRKSHAPCSINFFSPK